MSDKLFDMSQSDFKEFISGKFVTRDELERFATKDELYKVAKETGDHSTNKIEIAISEGIKKEVPEAVKGVFIMVGINPEKPQEMQDFMASLRMIVEDGKKNRTNIRSSFIKESVRGVVYFICFGIMFSIARAANLLK
jgi:hypothetical protein